MTAPHHPEPALALRDVSKRFGGTTALEAFSIDVRPGEIHGLIGPNGAGKTTAINIATGVYRPDEGSVWIRGSDVTAHSPARRAATGLARTFQGARLFDRLTVEENVAIAIEQRERVRGRKATRGAVRETVRAQLEHLRLADVATLRARELPFGRQKQVEIVRAMCFAASVLLLDEPTSGLSADEISGVTAAILAHREGLGVLLVEHNMDVVMTLCSRITVIDAGRWLATGTPDEIQRDTRVVAAYLGA